MFKRKESAKSKRFPNLFLTPPPLPTFTMQKVSIKYAQVLPDLKAFLEWAFVSNPDISKECWCWSFHSKNDISWPGNAGALLR